MDMFANLRKKKSAQDTPEREYAKEFKNLQIKASIDAKDRFVKEIDALGRIKDFLCKEDIIIDEMVLQLHNIVSIVPEEQYRFIDNLKALFNLLPREVRLANDVNYVIEKLNKLNKEMLASKLQFTDISMYWTSYRRALYAHGVTDNHQQRKIQSRMKDKMMRIINTTIEKRSRGIQTAEKFIRSK